MTPSLSSLVSLAAALLLLSASVSSQGICGGSFANPGVCGSPATNYVAPSQAAVSALSKYTQIVHIYLTANSFDFLFGAYPGANNIPRALASNSYNPQLTEAGYVGNTSVNGGAYACLPCDTVGYINNATSPFNSSYCTASGQAAGFCIPNAPFEASPYLSLNTVWPTDPKHTFYATQYNDNGGKMNGFVWASGKAGAFGMAYYNLTGSYLFQLAQNYTLFDAFFQSAYGGVMINHLYAVSAQVPTWNTTANPACPTYIYQNYTVFGNAVSANTTNLYPYNWVDSNGVYLPVNDASLFTPDCHVVENVDPFTLGKSPNLPALTYPHIGNLLTQVGVSWAYYYADWNQTRAIPVGAKTTAKVSLHENPFTYWQDFASINSTYSQSHIKDEDQFFSDLANGVLPNVTWVKPDQTNGAGVTDSSVNTGQAKLQSYMNAIYASQYWQAGTMMVIISYSDSDGLYDHVPPYTGDSYGPGGRVPTIVVSPDHAGGKINSQPYETASWLRMLGTRFGFTSSATALFNPARQVSTADFTNMFTDPTRYWNGQAPSSSSTGAAAAAGTGASTGGGAAPGGHGNGVAARVGGVASVLAMAVALAALLTFA